MDRDEVLRRSREEKNDEMVVQVRDKAMKWTYIALVLSAAFFSLIRGIHDEPIMDLCATVCISVSAGRFYCFSKTKDKFNLIMAIVTLIVAIAAGVRFFMGH